ncbi:MAG: L,D-transpeptidase [Candidatus Curtissbacteria bacterium]|nr:L,D-transpeptidase [Candidatus Curtissbacteria bacterium]
MRHILIAILAFVTIAVLIALPIKRHVYRAYQNIGLTFGFNFNNISQNSYKQWIETQPGSIVPGIQAIFLNEKVNVTNSLAVSSLVLGQQSTADDSKWIEIDLSEQRLYMKENGNNVNSFLISSGKWSPTPTGEWRIWTKLRYTRMRGGSKALGTFYDLPNVPYTMYYYQGYGIHGAYWHNNFGQPMSHGCINMRPEEAGIVFNWASVGTKVVVRQ